MSFEPIYEQSFINVQSDFFSYLVENQIFKSIKTCKDYITRLRYVSRLYKLDNTIKEEYITYIVRGLMSSMEERDRYNTRKGISDLTSALKKFLEFAKSDYRKRVNDSILNDVNEIEINPKMSITEKEAIIKSRLGQGLFRQKLIDYWHGCSVTQCHTLCLLLASHIRPWRFSDNQQRLDVFNGLLLTPNLDKLFDKGYISFDNKGNVILSSFLPDSEFTLLGIKTSMKLLNIDEHHLPYLKYHRDNCLL